jgi:hypothetical protein
MREPSPRVSRFAIAGGLLAVIAVGTGGFLLGRDGSPAPVAAPTRTVSPMPIATASMAPRYRLLARADLIALGNAAADAAASGAPLPEPVAGMTGRRFRLYLPFGCDGPADDESGAPLRWRYDAVAAALRVHVDLATWPVEEWDKAGEIEALEGFWIARPWSTREICASGAGVAAPTGSESVTLPGQTFGVAQLLAAGSPRQLRRDGRPYEAVIRMSPDTLRLKAGLRLRLIGQVAAFGDGRAVRCLQPGGRDQRPICLLAASLEEIGVENPATGETLAVWTTTSPNRGE